MKHQNLTYDEAWEFLDQLQFFKIKLGLDSISSFMESLDNPHQQFPCIHVGGTNGKGSVGATLLSILTEAGYKVGFYTSPHLSSVRERFRIGNKYISSNDFAHKANKIIRILNGRQIMYFEFTTALAMLWFAEQKVDLAILEVGLGGRLDATNIVTPLVSVITNVSMDHEQYLGNTISEVAFEKAGIIKQGVPVVTGASEKALDVIADTATKKNSPLYVLGQDFSGIFDPERNNEWTYNGVQNSSYPALPMNLKGDYQVGNASIALAALEVIHQTFPVSQKHIELGLRTVHWPGRLEEFWRTVDGAIFRQPPTQKGNVCHFLLDGAHNPDGADALLKSLESDFIYDRLTLVWASMADKDSRKTLLKIAPLADKIIFTKPYEERSALPENIQKLLPNDMQQRSICIDSVNGALDYAMADYSQGTMICIAGSLYLVGRTRQILCGELVNDI